MSIASFFKPAGNKRVRDEEDATASGAPTRHVQTIATWNANSLFQRIQHDGLALAEFFRTHAPDVLFISEVRSPALGPPGCKKGDGLPRQHGKFSRATKALAEEADAVARLCKEHGYRAYWSLAEFKYSGCGLLVRTACTQPHSVRFNIDGESAPHVHHKDGRVIRASFEQFDLLGTYSPNNGTAEESFARRRAWDAACLAMLQAPRHSPLVWVGDLNVAAEWTDVGPDPHWFRFKNGQEAASVDDRGQPGFTPNEQRRFAMLLHEGGLVDAYRSLHPNPDWQRDVTWRGTPGRDGVPELGRYYNKGMRIDYVLVDKQLEHCVESVLGKGADRQGFMGSDHCPVMVKLRFDATKRAEQGAEHEASGSRCVQSVPSRE
ncbi:hypothetical protein AB1Y20_017779 [Prymnesium parvum]|uniref:DNA-(apurinic or apyrimidinic site) endonuclease n=1 Tax=Prymnesium parvum TaxID=97485 RepID=A0AB34JLI2_PRYPA